MPYKDREAQRAYWRRYHHEHYEPVVRVVRGMPLCQNCGEQTNKRGARLCIACYKVLPRFTKESRFWAKVDKSDGCWEWTGWRGPNGYGELQSGPQRKQTRDMAHRLSWEMHNGPIPAGMVVCHRCDNPPCVRPDHLFLGTPSDNANDMWSKGRGPVGEKNGHARLTEADVRVIRSRMAAGENRFRVAADFGVSEATVRDVVTRRHWRHVA